MLDGNKFIPEMHLRRLGFTYSTLYKNRIQKFKETGDSRYTYQKEQNKACFQHDMAYEDFKDLPIRLASDKLLHDNAFNIAKNLIYDAYQRGLALMVYKFFDKKSDLAEELQQPIIKKFENRKVDLSFKDNNQLDDLANI